MSQDHSETSQDHNGASAAESGSSRPKSRASKISPQKSAYLWGAASGVAVALFAPMFRPAARGAVKSGIRLGRYAKKVGSQMKEEFQDIAAEAQADLEHEDNRRHSNGKE